MTTLFVAFKENIGSPFAIKTDRHSEISTERGTVSMKLLKIQSIQTNGACLDNVLILIGVCLEDLSNLLGVVSGNPLKLILVCCPSYTALTSHVT